MKKYDAIVSEFHVAPEVSPSNGLPYHEWFVEFRKQPNDMTSFSEDLDVASKSRLTSTNNSLMSMKMNFRFELVPESLIIIIFYFASKKLNLLNSAGEFFVHVFRRQTRAE